jgi:hypothetical protein
MTCSSSSSTFLPAIPTGRPRRRINARSQFVAGVLPLCLLATLPCRAATAAADEPLDADREGRRLAREFLELRPAENFTHAGTLRLFKSRGQPVEIPVRCETVVTATNWTATYSVFETNAVPVASCASFTVVHATGQPNQYRVRSPAASGGRTGQVTVLTGDEAMIPFADSDFWLADLGMEFFHWPQQKLLKKEMRKGRFCHVLESVNPHPAAGYARVLSWLDLDTGGIIQARAYDAQAKLLKEFDVKGVTRVKGQWQVDEVRIRNAQTGSRTTLKFEFDQN